MARNSIPSGDLSFDVFHELYGTEAQEEDSEAFEEKMKRLALDLSAQFKKSHKLDAETRKSIDFPFINLEEIKSSRLSLESIDEAGIVLTFPKENRKK